MHKFACLLCEGKNPSKNYYFLNNFRCKLKFSEEIKLFLNNFNKFWYFLNYQNFWFFGQNNKCSLGWFQFILHACKISISNFQFGGEKFTKNYINFYEKYIKFPIVVLLFANSRSCWCYMFMHIYVFVEFYGYKYMEYQGVTSNFIFQTSFISQA